MSRMRIGHGYDVHKLQTGLTLTLGGVVISSEFGCVAHSDGDVLLHALCDALLGAAGERDIGHHFPDSDPAYRGISSLLLLSHVRDMIHAAGFSVGNVDMTVILERPKIATYIPAMQAAIAKSLGISTKDVSIKATTSEQLGFVGAGAGVVAHAVALLETMEESTSMKDGQTV